MVVAFWEQQEAHNICGKACHLFPAFISYPHCLSMHLCVLAALVHHKAEVFTLVSFFFFWKAGIFLEV